MANEVTTTATATSSAAPQGSPKGAGETVVKDQAAKATEAAPKAEPTLELVKPDAAPATPEAKKPETSTPPAEIVYDLKVAEDSVLDPKVDVEAVVALAKEQKWTPEIAGKVLEQREAAVKAYRDFNVAKNKEIMAAWPEQLKNDKEIGGEKLAESLEDSKRFLAKFGDAELVKALEESNLGNYPAFVRLTAKAGRLLRDDRIVTSNEVVTAEKTVEDLMFPMKELSASGGQG